MKQTFGFSSSFNPFNTDKVDVTIDFDEVEMIICEDTLFVSKDLQELKRFYKGVGDLIKEMETNETE